MRLCGLLGGRLVNPGFTEARREAAVTSGGHIWPATFLRKDSLLKPSCQVCFFSFYALSSMPLLLLFLPPPLRQFFIHCLDKCTRPFKITGAAPEGTVEQCGIPGNLRWLFRKIKNKKNEGARKSRGMGGSTKRSSKMRKIKFDVCWKGSRQKIGWLNLDDIN